MRFFARLCQRGVENTGMYVESVELPKRTMPGLRQKKSPAIGRGRKYVEAVIS